MKTKILTLLLIVGLATACKKSADMDTVPDANSAVLTTEELKHLHNDTIPKVCLDRVEETATDSGMVQTQGVLVTDYKWPNGKTLKIFFINGGDYLQGKV